MLKKRDCKLYIVEEKIGERQSTLSAVFMAIGGHGGEMLTLMTFESVLCTALTARFATSRAPFSILRCIHSTIE